MLFEDESYTNLRTYFWALQSLRIINDCIKSILTAWEISNTSQILRAEQDAIRLSCKSPDDGPGGEKAIKSLAAIEIQTQQLKDLIKENDVKQEDIIALRDGVRISIPYPKFNASFSLFKVHQYIYYSVEANYPAIALSCFLHLAYVYLAFQRFCSPGSSNNGHARRQYPNSNIHLNALPPC